ncbi:MAG: Rieske 2Fe-2S domain-containing protein [Bdellovibrionales bacterium]|nr:Rieske 2Fe-2S domain-containing protein [Bdellovibrionales bacterium]
MQDTQHWRNQPKDGASRWLNEQTQPARHFRVLNQPGFLTRSWYSVLPSAALAGLQARSVTLGKQRVTLFRGESGRVYAIDAFCPHFGADLGNGKVKGENIQCYFHQWEFSGDQGNLEHVPSTDRLPNCAKLSTYSVVEKWGMIWVHSDSKKVLPFPFVGLAGQRLGRTKLFVHHHALMMSAVDLHHFFSVHNLDIDFKFETRELSESHYLWQISGEIPKENVLTKMAHWLLGGKFQYEVEFFGGNLVKIEYGVGARLFGKSNAWKIPSVQIAWSSFANEKGVSDTDFFVLYPNLRGFFAPLKRLLYKVFSYAVLLALKDDDVKAYPHMKFNPQVFVDKDRASVEFIKQIEGLEEGTW